MIKAADFFVLRTPVLPVNANVTTTLFQTDAFAGEALFLASKSAFLALENGRNAESLELTLQKYLKRMTFRCTPFGLFSGISIGKFSNHSSIRLADRASHRRVTKLDSEVLAQILKRFENSNSLRDVLRYTANDSIYRNGKSIRYIEQLVVNEMNLFQVSSAENSEYLNVILEKAKSPATLDELASLLVSEEISHAEAKEFLNELIDSALLKSELQINITGKSYQERIVQIFDSVGNSELSELFSSINSKIKLLDEPTTKNKIASYREIETIIHDNGFVKDDTKQFFQVDLFKPAIENCLSAKILDEIKNGIDVLYNLFDESNDGKLAAFAGEFIKRYGEDRIPLLKVMDADIGIGYPVLEKRESDKSPLTDDLKIPETKSLYESIIRPIHVHLWNTYRQSFVDGTPIILDRNELTVFFNTNKKQLPASFFTFGTLISSSTDKIDAGEYRFDLNFTMGPSAANVLARFCHLDLPLQASINDLLLEEEQSYAPAILAEVVHLPQNRMANILSRPKFRNYEIPILSESQTEEAFKILLDDLYVHIEYDRVVLSSNRLNREIIPRLTSAHNFRQDALPVYQFLCDLQFQGLHASVKWDWAGMERLAFLPRIEYGKNILAKARWFFDDQSLKEIKHENVTPDQVRQFLHRSAVANHVVLLSNSDMKIPINLNLHEDITLILQHVRLHATMTLLEDISNEGSFVESSEGKFTNELIIPWRNTAFQGIRPDISEIKFKKPVKYAAGSEWYYLKLYCGVKIGEELMLEKIYPYLQEKVKSQTIDKWFFVRYADPDFHIRIRICGRADFYKDVIHEIHELLKSYLESNAVWNLQIETYQREIRRYGENFIEFSESLFFYDSEAIIQALSMFRGDERDEFRWQLAAVGIDAYLNLFQFTLDERIALFKRLHHSFGSEFNLMGDAGKQQLKKKYRDHRKILFEVLSENQHGPGSAAREIFTERNNRIFEYLVNKDLKLREVGELHIENYIHMFLNRLFRSKPRLQEAILYDFLHQHYGSVKAMSKAK